MSSGNERGGRSALHSRRSFQLSQELIQKNTAGLLVVAAPGEIDVAQHHAVVIETGFGHERITEAFQEKAGEHEHDQRDGHLQADQKIAHPAAAAETAASAAERLQNITVGKLPGGRETKGDAAN